MNENKTPNNKYDKGGLWSWVCIVAALFWVPPLGVFLLISMLTGRDLPKKLFSALFGKSKDSQTGCTGGKYYATFSSSQSRAKNTAGPDQIHWEKITQQKEQEAASDSAGAETRSPTQNAEKRGDGIAHISRGKKALFWCGWIVLAVGIISSINSISDGATLWEICRDVATISGGLGMLFTSHSKDKKEQLYQNCVKIVGNKVCYDLKALSQACGIKPKKMERELHEMMERHYFPEGTFIDVGKGQLILNREEAEKQAESIQNAASDREQDKYDLLLQELERACGRITDREMMEKSVQIRGLTAAIFHAVRQEPEKEGQISNFLNYYFPTTLKLLDSYADIESKGYQGEKLAQTGVRIKATADTLITAFQKQLDNLYLHDVLDVDSDIDVLETMLKRDGLSESDFNTKGTPGIGL